MTLYEVLSSKSINYNNDKCYRECLRDLFHMNKETYQDKINNIKSHEELDAETEDEISYDDDAAGKMMDQVYEHTKSNALFNKIYLLAAAKFLSEDVSIGIAVLFSYDYLSCFFACLVDYLKDPTSFNNENIKYIELIKKIS